MKTKLLEIRDRATFIPALAIQYDSEIESERYLLARAGYGRTRGDHQRYIALCKIDGGLGHITTDIYDWVGSRTMQIAHDHIIKNWDQIKSGDVIDVEFILGEIQIEKISERLEGEMS